MCGIWSPPSRAAWIEIVFTNIYCFICTGRRLHGRRGLKYPGSFRVSGRNSSPPSRAAWIEIGLRCRQTRKNPSPPSRAAWIEIMLNNLFSKDDPSRRLHGRRGLKFLICATRSQRILSPPSRAAWIEIAMCMG